MATWLQQFGDWNTNLNAGIFGGKNAAGVMQQASGFGKAMGSLGINAGNIGGIANTIGNMATGLLAGQNQTGIGNAMQTIGGLASNIPGVGGLIGAGVGVVGGLVNAAFGSHINEEFVNQTQNQANTFGSRIFNSNTNSDLLNDWQSMVTQSNVSKSEVGSDGWFSNKASRETARLNERINEANRRQLANFSIAAANVDAQNDLRILQNMAAYGGPINSFRKYYADGGLFNTPQFFTFEPQIFDDGGYLSKAKALIRQNEGFMEKPYADSPKGKNWRSVGYGFNDSGFRDKYPEGISKHYEHGITKKQAEEELDYFLNKAEKQLKSIYGKQWNDFTDSQKAAILDTYYQRPASVGKSSRFYKAVTAGEDPSKYLGVAGFNKRNSIRQNVFSGGKFTGQGYSESSNTEDSLTYPSSILEATSPIVDYSEAFSGVTPTQAKALELNLTAPNIDFLASLGQSSQPTQSVPTVGTVEDFLASYGDFEQNLFAHGGRLGKYFDGEGEEPNSLKVERSPHVDLAVNNPWLYNKLHPKKKKEKYEPTTFAGRIAQVAGASELGQKYTDYTSSVVQQVPVVGLGVSALDLGYDTNRLYHNPSLGATKDVALDAASLLPALRKTLKGWWMKGNSGSFITEGGQVIDNPRLASSLEVMLQPYRTAINTGVYAGRAADFIDDSKAYLQEMWNSSPVGKWANSHDEGGHLAKPTSAKNGDIFKANNGIDMSIFNLGGGMTHGVNWDTGVDFVSEGQSHEQNPYGGVMVGQDDQGTPNLVEEGEAIWNGDYVFSRRMKVPKKLREKYKLPDNATFADAVKVVTKESEERPNDEISRATQDHILGEFADSQEELRAAKAQRAMDKQMQLQDDFLMGMQFGLGGMLFSDGGGLSRDKDYGSKDKPYPNVKNGDFAGGGRSYPIPTKADAVDALRLAGLHGRSDVKAKVYAKYPELKKAFGGSLFENPFAYGGELGNIFAGEGDRPNSLTIPSTPKDPLRILWEKIGGAKYTDMANATVDKFMEDNIYSHVDDIIGSIAKMSEPQLDKFFSTPIGQRVASFIADSESTGSNVQQAGVQRWMKATGRLARPVQRTVVNAAKRAMAQSKLNARGQMRTPKGGGSQKVLNETMTPAQAAKRATTGSTEGLPQGWNFTRGNTSTVTTEKLVQDLTKTKLGDKAFTGRTAQTSRVNPKSPTGKAATSRGTAPDLFEGLEGTLNMRAPIGSGNFGYLPWVLGGAGVGGAGYGLYKGLDWLAEGLTNPDGTIAGVNDPATQATINSLPSEATSNRGTNKEGKAAVSTTPVTTPEEKLTKSGKKGQVSSSKKLTNSPVKGTVEMPPLSTEMSSLTDLFGTTPVDTSLPEQGLVVFDPKIMGNPEAMANGTRTTTTDESGTKVTRVTGNDEGLQRSPFKPKQTWTRYAPIAMNALFGLKEMLTPADYTNANAIMEAAYQAGQPVSVGTEYIGDYRKRDPFDPTYLMNTINQNAAAANRNFMNISGGNRAVAMSGILANDLVTQRSLAEAARQAYLANRTDDAQVAEFNRGTNIFNAQAQNTRNLSLAQLNSGRQSAMLSGIAQGARLRQAIKDQRDAAIAANLSAFAQGLGDIGWENYGTNQVNALFENGYTPYWLSGKGNVNFRDNG